MEMSPRLDAVATWISALTRGGLLFSQVEERGVRMAVVLVGEAPLASLREWFEPLSAERRLAVREAAFSLAIHALVADGVCSEAEGAFLEEVFDACAMTREERGRWHDLVAEAMRERRKLPHPETIAEVCDHPVLREILLAVAWHVMGADGAAIDEERATFTRLARIFSVEEPRATQIAETVDAYRS
jgi:uncharacterized tellurite resistance protein B-like protein